MTALADHGKLIWNTMMSLDGFVADSDEAMDWVFGFDNTAGSSVSDLVDRLGALLVGRRTMDVEDRNQPGFYGGAYTGPFFVVTRDTDRAAPVVNGVTGTVLNGPIDDAVHKARRRAAIRSRSRYRVCRWTRASTRSTCHLVMPDPERPTAALALDGWSWFNGDGLELEVTGDSAGGLSLPLRWTATTCDSVSA